MSGRVAIVGGGASGLMCAVHAKGSDITIFEKNTKVGKKLLTTGNGRCNFTNRGVKDCPRGADNDDGFVRRFCKTDVEGEMNRLGIVTVCDDEGRVYPATQSSKTVLDCLLRALSGVNIVTGCGITSISRNGAGFVLRSEGGEYAADRVVLAVGGAARAAYSCAGLAPDGCFTPLTPSLTPVLADGVKCLDGLRQDCTVTLSAGGRVCAKERGEVQFRSFGLSGIVCFNMSSVIARGVLVGVRDYAVSLDLLPDTGEKELTDALFDRYAKFGGDFLTGMLNPALACEVQRRAEAGAPTASKISMPLVAKAIKYFSFRVTGLGGFDAAQVTCGGIRRDMLNGNLGLICSPGMYACGEAVDVDGVCGGYNLHWAFASGMAVGRSIRLGVL